MPRQNEFDDLFASIRKDHIQDVSGNVQEQSQATDQALREALPELLEGLRRNTQHSRGAEDLANALDRDHDGSILNDLQNHMRRESFEDGEGILKHILGDRKDEVAQRIAGKSGINLASAGKLLAMLAPVLLGVLGKARKSGMNPGDLAGWIKGGLGGKKAGCLMALLPLLGKFLGKRG